MDDLTKWAMGIFAAAVVSFGAWLGKSVTQQKQDLADFKERVAREYASTKAIDELRQDVKGVANVLHELVGEFRASQRRE